MSEEIKYVLKNGKYVFSKSGVYFSLSAEQLPMMRRAVNAAIREENKRRGVAALSAKDQIKSIRSVI